MSNPRVHLGHADAPLRATGNFSRSPIAGLGLMALLVVTVILTGCRAPNGRGSGLRGFTFYNREGELKLTYKQREDVDEPRLGNNERSDFKEAIFEETLSLRTQGFLHHPALLNFALGGVLGLRQAEFEENSALGSGRSHEDGDILEFDISGTVLQTKPYPFSFHASSHRSLTPRPFRSSIEALETNYGVTWQYISDKTPVLLRYDYFEVDLDPFIQAGDVEGRRENEKILFETGYLANVHNRLLFRYDRESISEEPLDTQYDRDKVELTHTYEFGADYEHRLFSRLFYLRQTGTFDTEHMEWSERLSLEHSPGLKTSYSLRVADRQQGSLSGGRGVDERSYFGSAALDHRLYDNLSSHLDVYYQDQDFEFGTRLERVGGAADFRYYRHNPWGKLSINYRVGVEALDTTGGDQQFEVVDEGRVFVDPEPIILNDPNTEVGSIRLIREDRTEIYELGSDYRVRAIGDRVEIERVVTGRIEDGERVLVSYRYRIGGAFELDTVTESLEIRQDFECGFAPYYKFHSQSQTLNPDISDAIIPEDITANTIGADFVWGTLQLNAEYEEHESSINPFRAYEFSASYSHQFEKGAAGNLAVRWSDLDFRGPQPRSTRLLTVTGGYRHPFTPNLIFEGTASYRNQEDTLSGDDEGVELDLSLVWDVRSTEFRVDYRFTLFEDDITERESSTLFVQLKRRF